MITDDFFYEKPITINIEGEKSFTVFMQPLKIKDIPVLNRIIFLQERDPDDIQATSMLIGLMRSTLSMSGSELPVGATSELITYFLGLNFPYAGESEDKENSEREDLKKKTKQGVADCVDFLSRQGHSYTDIQEYTIPQFKSFIDIAAERLGLKKPTISAEEAFKRLGIPIRPRSVKDN